MGLLIFLIVAGLKNLIMQILIILPFRLPPQPLFWQGQKGGCVCDPLYFGSRPWLTTNESCCYFSNLHIVSHVQSSWFEVTTYATEFMSYLLVSILYSLNLCDLKHRPSTITDYSSTVSPYYHYSSPQFLIILYIGSFSNSVVKDTYLIKLVQALSLKVYWISDITE